VLDSRVAALDPDLVAAAAMADVQAELDRLLAQLADAGVEFILIGGAAALVHGAPITTQDIDIGRR
jgi:hypothetical protein